MRQRNVNGRQACGGYFGDGHRAGAAHDEVSHRKGGAHVLDIRQCGVVRVFCGRVILLAVGVQKLEVLCQVLYRSGNSAVDAGRALGPAGDENGGKLGQVPLGARVCGQVAAHLYTELIGHSSQSIGLENIKRDAEGSRSDIGRPGHVAAGAKDDIRLDVLEYLLGLPHRAGEVKR